MSRTRIAWLIALILAASTLPANEWSVAAAVDRSDDAESPPETPPPDEPSSSEEEETSSGPQPALEADVWDGGAVRTQCTGTAAGVRPVVLTSLPPGNVGSPTNPGDFILPAGVEARMPGERSQRCWLTCRYAHAPPLNV